MNTKDNLNEKFYNFINMYNAVIKHCSSKNRHYNVNLFHIEDKLYFQVIDKESQTTIHNTEITCNKDESKLLYSMITSEFILNHQLKYAAYVPMNNSDVLVYRNLLNNDANIIAGRVYHLNNNHPMQIHALENTNFTLNIYQYEGIDEQTELLHQMAIQKISNNNQKLMKKK